MKINDEDFESTTRAVLRCRNDCSYFINHSTTHYAISLNTQKLESNFDMINTGKRNIFLYHRGTNNKFANLCIFSSWNQPLAGIFKYAQGLLGNDIIFTLVSQTGEILDSSSKHIVTDDFISHEPYLLTTNYKIANVGKMVEINILNNIEDMNLVSIVYAQLQEKTTMKVAYLKILDLLAQHVKAQVLKDSNHPAPAPADGGLSLAIKKLKSCCQIITEHSLDSN